MQVYFASDKDVKHRTITLPGCSCTLLEVLQSVPIDPAAVERIEVGYYTEELEVRHDWLSLVHDDQFVVVYPRALPLSKAEPEPEPQPKMSFWLALQLHDARLDDPAYEKVYVSGESCSVQQVLAERRINEQQVTDVETGYELDKMSRRSLKAKVYDGEYLLVTVKHNS